MNRSLNLISLLLLLITPSLAFSQSVAAEEFGPKTKAAPSERAIQRPSRRSSIKPPALILERDVRAQLGFLASDAMQGRGSGTGYERIAAEYIGSQFRQFGLEPGGDVDATGT